MDEPMSWERPGHTNHRYAERMDGSRYCWLCAEYDECVASGQPFTWTDPLESE